MVTFSSKSGLGNPRPKKSRKKVKQKPFTSKRAHYLKNVNRSRKTKIKSTAGQGQNWKDLNFREKIHHRFRGEGRNTIDPITKIPNWADGRKSVKLRTASTPNAPINNIKEYTKEREESYNFRQRKWNLQEEKLQSNKNKIDDWIKGHTDDKGAIIIGQDVETGDPALDKIVEDVLDDLDLEKKWVDQEKYTDEQRFRNGELQEYGPMIETNTDTGEVSAEEVQKRINEEYNRGIGYLEERIQHQHQQPIAEKNDRGGSIGGKYKVPYSQEGYKLLENFDPDFDMTDIEEIEEVNPELASRINEEVDLSHPNLEGFKIIGVEWGRSFTEKRSLTITNKDWANPIPIVNTDDKSVAYDYPFTKEKVPMQVLIGGDDKIVIANEDGRILKIAVPFIDMELVNPDDDDAGIEVFDDTDLVELENAPTDYEMNLVFDADRIKFADELFQPNMSLVEEDASNNPNVQITRSPAEMDCEESREFFNSAIDSLGQRLYDKARGAGDDDCLKNDKGICFDDIGKSYITLQELMDGINTSEFASYGFFYDPIYNTLISGVDFDPKGVPMTDEEGMAGDVYTGQYLNTDGEIADFLSLTWKNENWKDDIRKPGSTYDRAIASKGTSASLIQNSGDSYSHAGGAIGFVLDWMKEHQQCYKERKGFNNFDDTAVAKLQDGYDKAKFFKQRYQEEVAKILSSPVLKKLKDVSNKTANMKNSMDEALNTLAYDFQEHQTTTKELKKEFYELEKDPFALKEGTDAYNRYHELADVINSRVDQNSETRAKYNKVLEINQYTPISSFSVQFLDKNLKPIHTDIDVFGNDGINYLNNVGKWNDIDQTVLTSPGGEISYSFPKDEESDGGFPLIIREAHNKQMLDESPSMAAMMQENLSTQADLYLEKGALMDQSEYVKNLLTKTVQSLNSLEKAAEEQLKTTQEAIADADQTWAQNIAFVWNRLMANIIKIGPGIVSLMGEVGKLEHMLAEAIASGLGWEEIAALERAQIDAVQNAIITMDRSVEEFVDYIAVKPGGYTDNYDLKDWSTTGYQVTGLITDVLFDVVVTIATAGANKASTAGRMVNWVKDPTRLRWLGRKNAAIIDAWKMGKINKRQLLRLSFVENTPITIMTRLHIDSVNETENLINQFNERCKERQKLDPTVKCKKLVLSPWDRTTLEFTKPMIESYLDKIGIEALGNTKAMSRLALYLTGGAAKSKIKGIGLKAYFKSQIDQLVKNGGISYVGGLVVNIADEDIQEMVNMYIERSTDNKLMEDGWEDVLYNTGDFWSEEYKERLWETSKVTLLGIGLVNAKFQTLATISEVKNTKKKQEWLKNHFDQWSLFKSDIEMNLTIEQADVFLQSQINKIKGEDLNEDVKEKKIKEITDLVNKYKAELIKQHEILQKVDIELNDDVAAHQYILELELYDLQEELKGDLPNNKRVEKEKRVKEIEAELTELTNSILTIDEEDNVQVKEDFKSDKSKTFDKKQKEFLKKLEKFKEKGVEPRIFETNEEAEEFANDIGGSMIENDRPQQAQFIEYDGKKYFIFSKEAYLLNRKDKSQPKFDHELDHYLVDLLEQEFGNDITFKMAESILSSLENGDLEFENAEAEAEFTSLMEAYKRLDPKDKLMQADEVIANARDFMREGKIRKPKAKTSWFSKLKNLISTEINEESGGLLDIDLGDDVDFNKLLDLMVEDTKVAVKKVEDETPLVKKPKTPKKTKTKKKDDSILEPIGQDEDANTKNRFALVDNESEKKKLIQDIKDLVKKGAKENKDKIDKIRERIAVLNIGIENAKDVAIVEDPSSSEVAIRRAKDRLVKRNQEPIVNYVLNQKMQGDVFNGQVTLDDGTVIKGSVPKSEIKEILASEKFSIIMNKFFERDDAFKNMPIGLKLKQDLIKKWQEVVNPLVIKHAREKRDRTEEEGTSYFETGDVNNDGIVDELDTKMAEDSDTPLNMRTATGIIPGSDVFKKIKEGVVNTFKGKLPEVKTNKLKKALEKSFIAQNSDAVRLLIDEMGGVEKFLETYGKEVYEMLPQDLMNKSFQDFIIKGERVSPTEFDKLVSEGLMTKKEAKTARTTGYYRYTKKPYNKREFKKYHLKPEKGSVYSKKNQLVAAIAKELSKDATMEVLSSNDVMEMYNERNELLNQARVIIAEVADTIDRNPKSRFALDGVEDSLQQKLYQTFADAVREAGKNPNKIDILETKLAENFDEETLAMFDPIISNLKNLFRDSVSHYKKRLKSLADDSDLPQYLKDEVTEVLTNKTMEKGKGTDKSMKEMHSFNLDIVKSLPGKLMKALKGAKFFTYDYGYLDGGDKSKGKGLKFGPFKKQLDEINAVIESLKDQEDFDINAEDVELFNAAYGILGRVETILDKDIKKSEKLEELGFEKDGSVKPGSIIDKIQKANAVNTKVIEYLMTKSAEVIAKDPKKARGFLRWLESMTNNTKSLRALSRLNDIEIHDNSQGTYYNVSTGGFKSKLSPTEKKDDNWIINSFHPRYDEAKKRAENIYKALEEGEDKQEKIDKKIIELLAYKGEHIDVASNLMADMAIDVLEAADKLRKTRSKIEKEGIIKSLKNKIKLRLLNYGQSHVTKLDADFTDDAGTTNTTSIFRYSLMKSEDKVDVKTGEQFDPAEEAFPQEDINKIEEITKEEIKQIKEEEETKTHNQEILENAPVTEADSGPETIAKMTLLDKAIEKSRSNKKKRRKKARIFDFDDTVAHTNSKVFYTMPDGSTGELTAEEFADEGDAIKEKGGEFDFSDFNRVVEGKRGPLFDLLKKMKDAKGKRDIFILTARAPEAAPAIQAWLKSEGIDLPIENIICVGDSDPKAKGEVLLSMYVEDDYNDFYFADDASQNTDAIKEILDVIDVDSKVQQAKRRFALDGEKIANRLFKMVARKAKKDPESIKDISNIKAQIKGNKKWENPMAPSSTQNFTGLLYKFLGKGQEGNEDYEFLKDNLVRPYTRALNEIAAYKNTLIADFNATLDNFIGAGKAIPNLNEEAPGLGGYTYEDAIRILAWDNQGIQADGVPKSTMEKIRVMARNNPALTRMAEQLVNITKGDGYYYPGLEWRAGTMMGDLMQGVNKTTRPRLLSEWNQNIETVFGKDNGSRFDSKLMNAIEYQYGTKYRQAFEDMLRRMKSGRNRRQGNSKTENRFYDWLNNSVGAVMFFNMRSGLLQTLSAANFINWSFNNPAKAAAAFANQKQYWKDFMSLFNSDFLVDRRGGMKINISESEIFDATHNQSNKAKAFLNLLLKKGFSITQIADSFAIASGGATYYRNRIKDLVKKGMSEEEATAQAYEEWTALSREAQQSSDAMEVSSQQAGGLGRTILAFANTPMQYNRIIGKAIQDLAAGRGDWKSNISRILYYGALQNAIFNALQQAIFAAIGNGDEDELDESTLDTLNGMLTSLLRGMGVGGSIVSALKDVGLDIYDRSQEPRPEYFKSVFEALNIAPPLDVKVSKWTRGMDTYEYNKDSPKMQDYFSIDNPLYMSGALLTASVTNIPLDRLLQKMINVKDALAQDQDNWKRIALLMGWSEWQLESGSQKEERKEIESDEKHYYKALDNPSLYNRAEQEDILRQHGYSQEEIDGMKKQDDRVEAILKAEKSSGKKYTSKIPTEKSMQKEEEDVPVVVEEEEKVEVKSAKTVSKKVIKTPPVKKPTKVNFTENNSFKNHRVPVEKRNNEELKLYELPAAAQRDSLKSLGLSDKEIKALKYEGDRVRKILELQK